MLVVDASALVEFLIGSPTFQPHVYALKTQELHAPHLADIEVVQSLRRLSFRKVIQAAQFDHMMDMVESLGIKLHRHRSLLGRAWSLRHRCSAYDALYVALAESLACPLLTADGRLARAAEGLIPVERV